ncbi:MAG: amidohydrolase [Gammaproteobacteria bacterium]
MYHIKKMLLAAWILFSAGANLMAAGAPDTILINGNIVTVDDTFSMRQAVAIQGERILAVGSNQAIHALAGPRTEVIDLKGRTVIPGLIDNHVHFIRATDHWSNEARLDGITDRNQALKILSDKAKTLPYGAWLFALGGWFEDQFIGDRRGFTLDELDALVPDRPVFIQAKYDHAFVNSRWLQTMGIDRVRSGGKGTATDGLNAFVIRDQSGRASGRLNGGFPMIARAIKRFPPVSEAEQVKGIKAAMAYFNRLGLTTVFDPAGLGIQEASYRRIRKLADRGELTLRIFYTLWGGMLSTPEAARELVKKIVAAHPFQGNAWYERIAFGEVYYPAFHWDSMTRATTPTAADIEAARSILTAAAEGGWPVQTHAIQPESISYLLDVAEQINRMHPLRALHWSIAHADHIGAGEIERARALGMNLLLRSHSVNGGLTQVSRKFGDAAYHMPPLRQVQESGIVYGFGTDGTKDAQVNPFVTLWWATTGKMLNGSVITKEVLTREEALIAHTRSNAKILFREADLGAIKPGLLADMVVLDRDYMAIPLDEIKEIKPVATIVAGRIVYGAL